MQVSPVSQTWQTFLATRCDRLRHGGETEKVAEAITEDLRWRQLCRYTEDGRLEIDNGAAERSIRGMGTERSLCTSSSSV